MFDDDVNRTTPVQCHEALLMAVICTQSHPPLNSHLLGTIIIVFLYKADLFFAYCCHIDEVD